MKVFSTFSLLLLILAITFPVKAQPVITLRSTLYVQDSSATDVWGYFDNQTGHEYALVGSWNNISVIDVTSPSAPFYTAFIQGVKGFDLKVRNNYMYAVGGNASGTAKVIDLSNPASPVVVDSFPNAHNIFIDDRGYLISCFPRLSIYDLNSTPTQPALIWEDSTGVGHDAFVQDDTLYFFEGYDGFWIYDVRNRAAPILLSQTRDPQIVYAHSGSLTSDKKHLLVCDELARHPTADITVWDIGNLQNIQKVGQFADSTATVHNTYVIGNFSYTSYYQQGFRIFDVTDPANISLAAAFETFPDTSTENFGGAFGVYPFAGTGNVYVSDMKYGLFVFSVDTSLIAVQPNFQPAFHSLRAYPNPMGTQQQVEFELLQKAEVGVELIDARGTLIRSWSLGLRKPGPNRFEWKSAGLAAGIYTLRLQQGDKVGAIRIMIGTER